MPVTFRGHAGALHRPGRGPRLDTAVVICPPLGREGRCAHRALWRWAGQLAAQGLQVLRYDHLGEGDSLDLDPAADQWSVWLEGVRHAAAFCRAHTGADRIALVGLRSGATLAAAAAAAAEVDELVLMAPFETGAAWLNELRLTARVKGGEIHADESIEVDGLHLGAAAVATLEDVRPARHDVCGRILVAGPKAFRGDSDELVETIPLPGLAKLFRDAHVNEAPQPSLDRIAKWLLAGAAPARRPDPDLPPAGLIDDDWTEAVIAFGPGLRGVLCKPRGAASRQAVIFGNTGGDPRAGIGSFAARASRALAVAGVAAFRIDFAGVGESAAQSGWRSHVYETSRVADFRAAAAVLQAEGFDDITLAGVCTGGYHAVHAALEDPQFPKAMAFNAWLVWRAGAELESTELRAALRPADMPILARSRAATRRERMLRRLQGLGDALRLSWKALHPDASARAVRKAFAAARRRGVRIRLVFGRGDVSMRGLHADFHRGGAWLTRLRGVSVARVPGMDHALFSRPSQAAACAELCAFLGVVPQASAAEPGPVERAAPARHPPDRAYGDSSMNRSTGALASTSR